jgi:acetyl esterase/lipase
MKATTARMGLLLTSLASLLAAGCQGVYFGAINATVRDREVITSEFDPIHHLSLDVFRPAPGSVAPAPVVVFLYGGSWRSGERDYYRFVGTALAARGVLVVIPDYRKAPAAPFPAFMDDAARAVAWTRDHAVENGGDPKQITVMGHSAGAHIAALLGTDAQYLQRVGLAPRDLRGVIGLAGPYDFLPITDPKIKEVFGAESDWPRSQPVNFVNGDEPPFLLIHGSADDTVWPRNSEHLAVKLRAKNEAVTLKIVPGVGHIGLLNGFLSPRFSPVLADSLQFLGVADATVAKRAK